MAKKNTPWFQGTVAYQIYPSSFYDSNGDGIGDIKGIISKLDYLAGKKESLGVGAIWLCPFYRSPMADFGYDVSDYYSVNPDFGILDDFHELVKQAHKRKIKVIIDLVANHTSDEHPWFLESKSSKTNPKRDWYIWHDAKDGGPPNDWLSVFGGSAWKYDPSTGQYYLHSFSVKQPDLNWENPKVRQAIKDVMHFWLSLGIDGFRADAVYWLSKDHRFRDDPHPHRHSTHSYSRKGPHLYQYLRELTEVLDTYPETFMVVEASVMEAGEGDNHDIPEYLNLYKYVDPARSAPFNFEILHLPWEASSLKKYIDEFESKLKDSYLAVYTLGNHDNSRLGSRIGLSASRAAAMVLLGLPGMPFIYYGEEIGMLDVVIPKDLQKDPFTGKGENRDKVRSPMQWSDAKHAGFSSAKPWLPVSPNYKNINVKDESADSRSLLSLYRSLIDLRNSSDILKYGGYHPLDLNNRSVYGFVRRYKEKELLIVLNFANKDIKLSDEKLKGSVVLSTYLDTKKTTIVHPLRLRPHEGLIIALA